MNATPTRFAALVDIENTVIVGGTRLPDVQTHELFAVVDSYVAGMPVRAASGKRVLDACTPELAFRGWGLTLVPTEPDAADQALLDAGRHFAQAGVSDLVVVSGDHAFAPLAALVRLHVIAHPRQLSKALRLAATTVNYLPIVSERKVA